MRSNLVFVLVEDVALREVADLKVCRAHERSALIHRFEVLLALVRAVRVTHGLVQQDTDPVAGAHTWHFTDVLDFASAVPSVQLAARTNRDRLCLVFHEILIHALTLIVLEVLMAGCLHARFKRPECIISRSVRLLTDLVLLNLANVTELIDDSAATLIDDMHCEVWLRVVAPQRRLVVHHLSHSLALQVLQLQAHVGRARAELAFEEVLTLRNRPIRVEAQLRQECAFHARVTRIEFHYRGRCCNYLLLHSRFHHFDRLLFLAQAPGFPRYNQKLNLQLHLPYVFLLLNVLSLLSLVYLNTLLEKELKVLKIPNNNSNHHNKLSFFPSYHKLRKYNL